MSHLHLCDCKVYSNRLPLYQREKVLKPYTYSASGKTRSDQALLYVINI